MNIGERIGTPRPGENKEACKKRNERLREKMENLFSQPTGREVLIELIAAHHPLKPRFTASRSPLEAAYLDGELGFLNFILMNSGQIDLLKTGIK